MVLPSSTEFSGDSLSPALWGTVVAVQANYYVVYLQNLDATQPESATAEHPRSLLCTRRSRLKKIGQRVIVGDQVRIEEPDWQGGRAAIAEVFPRQSELQRPSIANVNQILLVFALAAPPLEPYQLSRFLVMAEMTGLRIQLCLSKGDLVSASDQRIWQERLQQWGYQSLVISVLTGLGLPALTDCLNQQITVVTGPSGVGKSSLINQLIPDLQLRVGQVSQKLSHGRHTTRHVELFQMATGGFLADTPGFNLPALAACVPEQLCRCFPEIVARQSTTRCQFSDCLHREEPNCVVRGGWERYPHYLEFLAAIQKQQPYLEETESTLKRKSTVSGQPLYEPKLSLKKYRRTSRRSQQQGLQDLYQELQ